jgi:hypothetical protein
MIAKYYPQGKKHIDEEAVHLCEIFFNFEIEQKKNKSSIGRNIPAG